MSEESIRKLRATMLKKYGSQEAWYAHLKEQAVKGGKKSKRTLTTEDATDMSNKRWHPESDLESYADMIAAQEEDRYQDK